MATCIVSGIIQSPSATGLENVVVKAKITSPVFSSTIQIVPYEINTLTSVSGAWSLTLVRSLSYILSIEYPPNSTDSAVRHSYSITVPNSATADFSTLATEL